MSADQAAVSFSAWKEALVAAGLAPAEQARYRREILEFLHHCKVRRAAATVMLAKEYLLERERQGATVARPALRWFFMAARGRGAVCPAENAERVQQVCAPATVGGGPATGVAVRTGEPPLARSDPGGADWERDLVAAARTAGFLWRTEETYRGWAARFVRFLAPRSPYSAEAGEVAAFLTRLAVDLRASPATQRQALNALVFFLQEGLHRQLGTIDFQRAQPRRRMPTVLSPQECRALFAAMEGTPRMMAELAYGAGLRLMELLRLRVHHVDLARNCVVVHAGKGDKDRVEPDGHAAS
ncbi:MAG: phage integrase N-terminal SAM-like domain-containing protein [Opitutaceae bacterium]